MDFMNETRCKLLALDRQITLTVVSQQTGISVAWLSRFSRGLMPNPGVRQVEALRNWLNAREA